MRKVLKTILTLTIIISSYSGVFGQELRSLSQNHAIGMALTNSNADPQPFVQVDPISLPFFEDFSDYGALPLKYPFPKSSKWTDRYAFINSEFADSMISIGVATLDAFDSKGVPYPYDSTIKGYSDTLTSRIINIDENENTPLYFSFFYQAGGKGDIPEEKDKLYVDFYTPEDGWVNLWDTIGGKEEHSFTQIIFEVPDSMVADSLRFRFRNNTSNKNEIADKQSNADQWHLDYIRLNRTNQPDTLKNLNDVTVMAPLLPSLLEFNSVPYRHFGMAYNTLKRGYNPVTIRTYFPERIDPIRIERTHVSFDLVNNKQIRILGDDGGIANEMAPMETSYFQDVFPTGFSDISGIKSAKFEIKCFYSVSGIDQETINDTVKRQEIYADYYAYDDGSAEFGFGISGESQGQIYIAERFRIFRRSENPDTLKAIYIFFNRTTETSHADIEFNICVWKNNGAKPGELLYVSDSLHKPDVSQQYINDFTRIELEKPLLVSDTIFIGIKQETTEFINIGYDINYNSLSNLFLKTSLNDWYNPSSFTKGSLMIRPSFSEEVPYLGTHEIINKSAVIVYPNPTSELLNFILPEEMTAGLIHVKVIDITGATVFDSYIDNNSIDVSSLKTGLYLAIISSADEAIFSTVKFIKK